MRVACDTGRRIEARWLALGGGVGDGEASGVVHGRLCPREISPAVCCVVWLWCSFGRRGVSLASITLGRFVLLVRLLAAALSRVAVAKRRVQFNSIHGPPGLIPAALGISQSRETRRATQALTRAPAFTRRFDLFTEQPPGVCGR